VNKLKFKLVELVAGREATLYSIVLDNEEESEFQKFVINYPYAEDPRFNELKRYLLEQGPSKIGYRDHRFKKETGRFLTPVVKPNKTGDIRVFCIRYSNNILIAGGGGIKKVRKTQQDPTLFKHLNTLETISDILDRSITKEKETWLDTENYKIKGRLSF